MTPFERALSIVLGFEGGDSDHPDDPGGLTRFGISQIAHPSVDVRTLTREQAGEIYRAEYWTPMACDEMPGAIALCVFDSAVNQGRMAAGRMLQTACGALVDGTIGPKTLISVHRYPVKLLVRRYQSTRAARYIATGGFATFGRGWLDRVVGITAEAIEWALEGK